MTVVRDAMADILDTMTLEDFVNNPDMTPARPPRRSRPARRIRSSSA